jgi:hypothetical protein
MNLLYDFISPQIQKIGFEDVLPSLKNPNQYILISTLPPENQSCLIYGTIRVEHEEGVLNRLLEQYDLRSYKFIIYGQHSSDNSVESKYRQLKGLGFQEVYIYGGGLFEWLLLQELYGGNEFKTHGTCNDILAYRVPKDIV